VKYIPFILHLGCIRPFGKALAADAEAAQALCIQPRQWEVEISSNFGISLARGTTKATANVCLGTDLARI
jgi:hypothetical protein